MKSFMKIIYLPIAIASLFISSAAFAQMPSTGGSNPNAQQNPGAASANRNPNLDNIPRQGAVGEYVGGNVSFPGGALPWDPILINVVCNGKTTYTSATDPKGNWVIAPIKKGDPAANREANSKAAAEYIGCNVQAALPGFSSNTLTITDHNVTDEPNLGTLALKKDESATGVAVSATTAAASKEAVKSYEKARSEWLENKPEKAEKDLQKAVQADPRFAEAWYQLGKMQEVTKSPDAANSFQKAIAADPKFLPPYDHIVPIIAKSEKWQEVADHTNHELELNPAGSPRIFYYNALANMKLNKPDLAETSATKGLAMDPNHTEPNIEQLLAVILANRQDYAGALQHLRNSLTYMPPGPNADLVKKQIAQLETIVPQSK
jgi:tetratricopeptide (TPR) repeat protein